MKKTITPKELREFSERKFGFEGQWLEFCGNPACKGVWIIWGRSFSGKTSFALRLAKYFADLGNKVAYVSLEQGVSSSMQEAFARECIDNVNLWHSMDIKELKEEISKQRSPKVIVVDSLQYLGINYAGYKDLKKMCKNKLLVFISHASEQMEPKGSTAVNIRYDADVKIVVEGFVANAESRFGGGLPITIWEKGRERNSAKKLEEYGKSENEWSERQMEKESDCSNL
jgi:archaellum biogenesis ATPase FlaH